MSETKKCADLITELDESFSGAGKESTTRRTLFRDVTAGAVGVAVAGALAQMGAPTAATAQQGKKPLEGMREPNTPPWPKGTTGNKYDHLFFTGLKEKSITEPVATPVITFEVPVTCRAPESTWAFPYMSNQFGWNCNHITMMSTNIYSS